MSELLLAFNKHKCDKAGHHYYKEYESILSGKRFESIKILEIGIFKGTSFSAFVDYLPNAQLYGVDIFTRIKPNEVPILDHHRVSWVQGDSTRSHIANKIKRAWGEDIKFDIIIDDGKHTPDANRLTFKNTVEFLSDDGIYYIEDVWPIDIMNDEEYNNPWIQKHKEDYTREKFDKFKQSLAGYSVTRIDLRKETKKPDSYLYKVRQ